jgi:DNA-binding response OmpR family regulator
MKENKIPQTGEPSSAALQSRTSPPRRILVADGDYDVRQLNAVMLTRSGYEVDAVADGAAAWQALNAGHYDLLVTNHKMPKVSGVELLMKLHAAHMALPVIMASAALPEDQFPRYPWLNPPAMLLQPCTVAELLGAVNKVLRASETARQTIAPSPNRQSQPVIRWFAATLVLRRNPKFS